MTESSAPKRQYMKYPWATWLNGELHRLTAGVDFFTKPSILRNQIYNKMSKNPNHQVKVVITPEGDLLIQVVPRTRVIRGSETVMAQESEVL